MLAFLTASTRDSPRGPDTPTPARVWGRTLSRPPHPHPRRPLMSEPITECPYPDDEIAQDDVNDQEVTQ